MSAHQMLPVVSESSHIQLMTKPRKILVGIPLDISAGVELLSWAAELTAQPGDVLVAFHVLVEKDGKQENKQQQEPTSKENIRMRRAKASIISMLTEVAQPCERKKVSLEARIGKSGSVRKGLVEEAASLGADFLVVGHSRNPSSRKPFAVIKYCFTNAPEGCLVIAMGKPASAPVRGHDADTASTISTETSKSSSRWKAKKSRRPRASSSFSSDKSTLTPCPSATTSPRTVLDGPASTIKEESSPSPVIAEVDRKQSKRLFSRRIPSHIRSPSAIRFFQLPAMLSALHARRSKAKGQSILTAPEEEAEEEGAATWRCFSYKEIALATNNFHPDNLVGKGGFAEVYKGVLDCGREIAVKRLAKGGSGGDVSSALVERKEKEFLTELGVVGHVCHPNTAYLLGCCIENGLHLVFDYSPNGTLAAALHGKNSEPLRWDLRYRIALGVARGLHYLHKSCRRRIIHRDIKASNVLLGSDYEPQISDFGLAKWLPRQWTHQSVSPIEGTFGYLAPEYFMHGVVDEKTDVFAFGVLLLEIVTGRKPVDLDPGSRQQSLLLWAKPRMESGDFAALVDPRMRGEYVPEEVSRVVTTASYCVRQSSVWRPSMDEVLQLLTEKDRGDLAAGWSWRMPEEYYATAVDELDSVTSDGDGSLISISPDDIF